MSNFNLGDKVVCVDDKFPPDIGKLYDALPVKDVSYVVRDIRLGINLTLQGDVSVLLIRLRVGGGQRRAHASADAPRVRRAPARGRIPRPASNAVFAPIVSVPSRNCKTRIQRRLKKRRKTFSQSKCNSVKVYVRNPATTKVSLISCRLDLRT